MGVAVTPIVTVTLLTLAMQGAHMGSRVVASLLALNLGASLWLIGVLIASYSIFQLAFALIVGRISDRYGSRRPMLGGTLTFCAGLVIPAVWPTMPALFVSAPLIGIGFVFFNVAVQNLAGTIGTAAERTRNFSTLSLGYSSGHMIGPVIAGVMIDRFGFGSAYIAFAVLTLFPIVTLALSQHLGAHGARSEPMSSSAFELLRIPSLRRMIIVSGLVTTGWDLYTFYVPIYGHSIGLSASTIGTILGAFAAASFIVRVALPVLTRRFSVETVLATAMGTGALLFLPFAFIEFVPALIALSFGIGLTLGVSQPLTLNLTYNRSPPGRSGEVTGLRLTINNITHIGVPLAAGSVGALLGIAPVFWASAAILAVSSFLSRRDRQDE
ncbi:MAG: MFS transporter [Betaproteobacteria bacterium]|jgi:predicted MFS family arabinose efflux permease|nr:MFS transporter [Betaproteobacteria bacterium]